MSDVTIKAMDMAERAFRQRDALVKLIERFSDSWVVERSGWNYVELDAVLKEARVLLAAVSGAGERGNG